MSYFVLLLKRCDEFTDDIKYNIYANKITEEILNRNLNSDYFENLVNKHEQFIYGSLFEFGIGVEKNL